jgi:hypothetical protein
MTLSGSLRGLMLACAAALLLFGATPSAKAENVFAISIQGSGAPIRATLFRAGVTWKLKQEGVTRTLLDQLAGQGQ